ncbi:MULTISPECIES: LysR family transcriptional regulator [Fusobacterium]|jgi:DNA-binding transcriptional LysR family regulator|uniref:LysR family transcriptional regulator n=1 Tax=Fusobacterium varium ATCC 27725 TaxID=469618 RepID=A0ABM6U0E7_FUSVA|nr:MULTISPECIES: LysR family transcriptional regulator [Fusobacterium]AVQ29707.1 LysR family transcriptional regulator [Fusobacterium varium ATCC 27725]EES64485.1 LysR substrate binding domain protein [Fusobacterium varium ATCC 27725]MCF0169952.1 LysR family transcriptional regulator [Fusobacterium varium]MCF2674315.1 LysR family transcriptional regulator [Fusobacterium varium]MCI6031879.1 LysR family transcriptional regulator [Fusobacterium varium]
MLDFRIYTFLELCKTLSYTKTAEKLHMTQPAVTQHIKFLEEFYKNKLFLYSGRTLSLTEYGKLLHRYLVAMNSDSEKVREKILNLSSNNHTLNFGATLTIGEYVIPKVLRKLSSDYPEINVSISVKDTKLLLEKLENGDIEFLLVEGFFEKTKYDSFLFSKEEFVAVCSNKNRFSQGEFTFEDLLEERIIVREKGSGSRDIFEKILYDNNLSINDFNKKYEIENIKIIKEMVKNNAGITFIYKTAIEEEIKKGEITVIKLKNFHAEREFNFVFLKDSIHKQEYKNWFEFMKKC